MSWAPALSQSIPASRSSGGFPFGALRGGRAPCRAGRRRSARPTCSRADVAEQLFDRPFRTRRNRGVRIGRANQFAEGPCFVDERIAEIHVTEPNSIIDAESPDEADRVSVGIDDGGRPYALAGVDDRLRLDAALTDLLEMVLEVIDGEVEQARACAIRITNTCTHPPGSTCDSTSDGIGLLSAGLPNNDAYHCSLLCMSDTGTTARTWFIAIQVMTPGRSRTHRGIVSGSQLHGQRRPARNTLVSRLLPAPARRASG